jgi:polyisoprenoid-binding protein YceI
MKRAIVLLLALAVAMPASAAEWKVDHAKSMVGFSLDWQDRPFNVLFRKWSADIRFDPDDLAHARARVTIDLSSLTSGVHDMDTAMAGPEGFAADHAPEAEFVTSWIRATGEDRYEARGVLTIKGASRAITLPFTLQINGRKAHMTGSAEIVRTDFGLGMGRWASDNPVARTVKVFIDLTATKAPQTKEKKKEQKKEKAAP